MAINLGAAYVDVVPSTRGLGQSLSRQVVRPLAAAGDQAATGFGSRFAAGVSRFVGSVASTIETAITGAALTAGGVASAALIKGWDRLTTIQDATATLTNLLGDSTEAAELLGEVLNVVRGTPFNLDQFASAASRLVGMGIEAQKVPGYLEAIGNAAALQGKNADEFVSRLVRVFGQIQAQDRIMGQDILQISETGVNALAILGNAFGVTTKDMRKMIEEGAVPAGEALDILAEGIMNGSDGINGATVALGGTMEALRQQLSGLVGGVGAAMARFGEAFIAPFTPTLSRLLNEVIVWFDEMTPRVRDFSTQVANSEGFQRFVDWIVALPGNAEEAVSKLRDMNGVLGPLLGTLGGFALKGLSGIPVLGSLVPGIGPVVGAIAGLFAQSPELRQSLGDLLDSLARLGTAVAEAFAPVVELVIPAVETLGGGLLEGLTTGVDYVAQLVEAFNTGGIGGVWDKITTDWENAGPNIKTALDTGWAAVTEWVSEKAENFPEEVGKLADGFTSWIDRVINGDGETPGINERLDGIVTAITTWIEEKRDEFGTKISTEWPKAFGAWIDAFINGDGENPGIVDRMQDIVDAVDRWIDEGGLEKVAEWGIKLAGAMLGGWVTVVLPGIITVFQSLMIAGAKALLAVLWMPFQWGWSIGQRILDGIRDVFEEKIGGVLGKALESGLKSLPGVGPGIGLATELSGFLASGGPAYGGNAYIVGEEGPELFLPGRTGYVAPNDVYRSLASAEPAGVGSGGWNVGDIIVQRSEDRRVAKDIMFELKAASLAGLPA